MSWLARYVRPRIRTLVGAGPKPADKAACPACQAEIDRAAWHEALETCPQCGHHRRLAAADRLRATLDPGYRAIETPKVPADPLGFRDQKRYTDRLREARSKTGLADAVLAASGTIEGRRAVVVAMEFDFLGGSMGAAVGEMLIAASQQALRDRAALLVFTASGGARMQEGMVSLLQMPRSTVARMMLADAKLPFVVILTDPSMGGVSASFAMLGDIQLAEPGARIGFAGARVIEQTVRETLPEGFQTAEYLLEHGVVDAIIPRPLLRAKLAALLALLLPDMPAREDEEESLTW